MTRPRRDSVDKKQGGLELPADICFILLKKTVSSNERKDTGRGAEVWEAKEESRARKRKEKKTEKGKIKVKKKKKKV